jgi:hypothetical protein
MRDVELDGSSAGGKKQMRREMAAWRKKRGLERDNLFDVNRLLWNTELFELVNHIVLPHLRIIKSHLRAHVREEIRIVPNDETFNHFPTKRARFAVHRFLAVEKVPKPDPNDGEKNDDDDQALARFP